MWKMKQYNIKNKRIFLISWNFNCFCKDESFIVIINTNASRNFVKTGFKSKQNFTPFSTGPSLDGLLQK